MLADETGPPFVSVPLARGAAGTFRILEPRNGLLMNVSRSTDIALVQVTLLAGRVLEWHGHAGPSLLIMKSGTMKMVEPSRGRWVDYTRGAYGCTSEDFEAGEAFVHPAQAHKFVNETGTDAVFYIAYLVPAGVSPAPTTVPIPTGPHC